MGLWVHNGSPAIDQISQYPTIVAVCICLTIWMLVILSLRVYVRSVMIRSFGPDDWTILFSAFCSVVYNGLAIEQSKWGLGLPLKLRPKMNVNEYSVINFAGRPFYMVGITGFKVALCLAYLRIVHSSNRVYKALIWAVMILAILSHLGGTLVLIFQCKPVQKSWIPATHGSCLPNDTTFYVLAGITIVFDCIIFVLPIPLLARVQINRRRKIALIGVFLLGLFTTVCSIMRMIQIITIAKDGNSTMLVLWGTVEMNVGIGLTCIPTLTPLFNYYRDKTARYGYKSSPSSSTSAPSQPQSTIRLSKMLPKTPSPTPPIDGSQYDGRNSEHDSRASIIEKGMTSDPDTIIEDNQIRKTTYVDIEVLDSMQGISAAVMTPPSKW